LPDRSEFTEAVLDIVGELKAARVSANKSTPIPFMQEKLRARDARNRFMNGTPQERRTFIETNGIEEAMKLARSNDGRA